MLVSLNVQAGWRPLDWPAHSGFAFEHLKKKQAA